VTPRFCPPEPPGTSGSTASRDSVGAARRLPSSHPTNAAAAGTRTTEARPPAPPQGPGVPRRSRPAAPGPGPRAVSVAGPAPGPSPARRPAPAPAPDTSAWLPAAGSAPRFATSLATSLAPHSVAPRLGDTLATTVRSRSLLRRRGGTPAPPRAQPSLPCESPTRPCPPLALPSPASQGSGAARGCSRSTHAGAQNSSPAVTRRPCCRDPIPPLGRRASTCSLRAGAGFRTRATTAAGAGVAS
jgi:translation initiation factor IF-2